MKFRFLVAIIIIAACIAVTGICLRTVDDSEAVPVSRPQTTSKKLHRPASEFGKPRIEVVQDGRLSRINHLDANGLETLEIKPHNKGEIRIQRTFSADGKLIKEEAIQNGQSIPIPTK